MSEGLAVGSEERPERVSLPPVRNSHLIADEELTMLTRMFDDTLSKLLWAALGVFFGSLQSFAQTLSLLAAGKPLAIADMLPVALVAASFAVAVIVGLLLPRPRSDREKLIDDIRARPKVPLRTIADLDYRQS